MSKIDKTDLPKLPNLPVEDLLALPPDEFEKVAQEANTHPDKLRTIFQRELQRKKDRQSGQVAEPPRRAMEESQQRIREAFESVVIDFDFLSKKWTQDEVQRLHEEADAAVRRVQDRRGERASILDDWIQAKYRKAYLGEAMLEIAPILERNDIERACAAAISHLQSREQRVNLPIEKWGIFDATRIFRTRIESKKEFQDLIDLYHAYKSDTMTDEQKVEFTRLFQKARVAAMTGETKVRQRESHLFQTFVPVFASAIRALGVYTTTYGNTSGNVERFDMPGNRGIGGQSGYYRGPRPHRDDYSSSGGQDDK